MYKSRMEGTLSDREGMVIYCRHVSVLILGLLYIDRQMLKHSKAVLRNFRGFCLEVLFPSGFLFLFNFACSFFFLLSAVFSVVGFVLILALMCLFCSSALFLVQCLSF